MRTIVTLVGTALIAVMLVGALLLRTGAVTFPGGPTPSGYWRYKATCSYPVPPVPSAYVEPPECHELIFVPGAPSQQP